MSLIASRAWIGLFVLATIGLAGTPAPAADDPRLRLLLRSLVGATQSGFLPRTDFAALSMLGPGPALCRGAPALIAEMKMAETARMSQAAAADLARRVDEGCHVRQFTSHRGKRFALVYGPAPYPVPVRIGTKVRLPGGVLVVCEASAKQSKTGFDQAARDAARRCLDRF